MGSYIKYTTKDTLKLIDTFINLMEKSKMSDIKESDISPLLDYPEEVIQKFLDAVGALTVESIKDKPEGVIGYITIRLNI